MRKKIGHRELTIFDVALGRRSSSQPKLEREHIRRERQIAHRDSAAEDLERELRYQRKIQGRENSRWGHE
jgi:hypothetical protein